LPRGPFKRNFAEFPDFTSPNELRFVLLPTSAALGVGDFRAERDFWLMTHANGSISALSKSSCYLPASWTGALLREVSLTNTRVKFGITQSRATVFSTDSEICWFDCRDTSRLISKCRIEQQIVVGCRLRCSKDDKSGSLPFGKPLLRRLEDGDLLGARRNARSSSSRPASASRIISKPCLHDSAVVVGGFFGGVDAATVQTSSSFARRFVAAM